MIREDALHKQPGIGFVSQSETRARRSRPDNKQAAGGRDSAIASAV